MEISQQVGLSFHLFDCLLFDKTKTIINLYDARGGCYLFLKEFCDGLNFWGNLLIRGLRDMKVLSEFW